METVRFNFYGVHAEVKSGNSVVLGLISRDFSLFQTDSGPADSLAISLTYFQAPSPTERIPKRVHTFKRKRSITIDQGGLRYNDYYGKALTIVDSDARTGEIYTESLNLAHELIYLMVLSKTGKALELQGWHKIHAMGVVKNKTALMLSMDSGGGKSTLCYEFLCDDYLLLSDDCPLIDNEGRVFSFPIRLGVSPHTKANSEFGEGQLYELERMEYGVKTLLDASQVAVHPLSEPIDRIVCVFGVRSEVGKWSSQKLPLVDVGIELIRPLLIGVGLPIIFEYFWEKGSKDFFTKSRIALRRIYCAWSFAKRASFYRVALSGDLEKDKENLEKLFTSCLP